MITLGMWGVCVCARVCWVVFRDGAQITRDVVLTKSPSHFSWFSGSLGTRLHKIKYRFRTRGLWPLHVTTNTMHLTFFYVDFVCSFLSSHATRLKIWLTFDQMEAIVGPFSIVAPLVPIVGPFSILSSLNYNFIITLEI